MSDRKISGPWNHLQAALEAWQQQELERIAAEVVPPQSHSDDD